MKNNQIFDLLQELITAKGPCGQEDEVRTICEKELLPLVDEMWIDIAGNLIGKVSGTKKEQSESINLMVHMDELSLIVKRINEDGSLRVNPLGGLHTFNFGQGPVDVMGDKKCFTGILSFGSMHTTKETPEINKMTPEDYRGLGKIPAWEDIKVVTRMTPAELKDAGVHPGTRVVIGQNMRKVHHFQDCIASYFLDNRASIAIALTAFKQMKEKNRKPKKDIYFVATCSEEVGAHGASYAAKTLPEGITLAIDVGPVAKEYSTVLNASPIIVYQDAIALYDKRTSDRMTVLSEQLGQTPQRAIFGSYGSDASLAYSRGQSAKAALICFPVENTHGYEIAHQDSLKQCADLLEAYLCD